MLTGLDDVAWECFEQPSWNAPSAVRDAVRTLAQATSEKQSREAYHRVLYGLGNNHAGTYFPVVVPAIPS